MINIKIDGNIENKVIREIKYFINDLEYECKITEKEIIIKTKDGFASSGKILVYICSDDFNNLKDKIKITTYGSAILGQKIAKILEEYSYENIEINIASDIPRNQPRYD